MKKVIVFSMICALLILSYSVCKHLSRKPVENKIEVQITSETTTPSTTSATTTKTTKKVVKTTQKTTTKKRISNVSQTATASKQEYMAYAKEYGNLNNTQLTCLDYLWQHESNWNPNSVNKSSGACGIPQALPCNKIAKQQGSNDWKAQIRWGINYINGRYKNPCSAWNHFKNKRWY
jgi:hypothetical protein